MTTNTRSAFAGLFLSAALLLPACGSPGADADDAPVAAADSSELVPTMPTTSLLEVSTTTVSSDAARSGFVSEVAAATPILGGLSEDDLGCVADRLLVELEPSEVVTLTRNGPRPDQASLAVTALRDCDLVLHVVGLGIGQSLAVDPDALPLEPDCLLNGVTADDLMPFLEAKFETGVVDLDDDEAIDLLGNTPVMANMIRCSTEAMLGVSADAPAVCAGLTDRLGQMLASLMEMEFDTDGEPDPFAMVEVFRVTDEVFTWLVDEVPAELRGDAKLVQDTTSRIGTLMAETLADLVEPVEGDPDAAEERMVAFLGVMARIEADLGTDMDEVEASSARLRNWTTATCGDSSSMLFELLMGMGA
ncbi:MAG: hypothetical protein VYD15_07475 [Actinomycetota bacterium]|nr:hypothetical protein [Actinomycetota bacterium]MEE3352554.1 hypothetical protein [Actinomycetota bacterium]